MICQALRIWHGTQLEYEVLRRINVRPSGGPGGDQRRAAGIEAIVRFRLQMFALGGDEIGGRTHRAASAPRQVMMELKDPFAGIQPAPVACCCRIAAHLQRCRCPGVAQADGILVEARHHLTHRKGLALGREPRDLQGQRRIRPEHGDEQAADFEKHRTHIAPHRKRRPWPRRNRSKPVCAAKRGG